MVSENVWIKSTKRRYLLFTLICLGYFAYGANITLIGVSFQDLTAILNVDSRLFSFGITIRYIVNCFAAILAGFSFNLFSRQIQYAISLFIYGLLIIIHPFIQNLTIYFMISGIIGLVSAIIDCVTNLWTFELFAEQINFHVLIVHFSYSAGQIVAPFIVRSYLSNQTNLSNKQIQQLTRIHIPFLICGSFFIFVSFFVFICYFIKPYVPPKRFIESKNVVRLDQTEQNLQNNEQNVVLKDKKNEEKNGQNNQRNDKRNDNQIDKRNDLLNDKQNDEQEDKQIKNLLPRRYYNSFIVISSLILGFEIANELNLGYYLPTYLNKSYPQIDQDTSTLMVAIIGITYCLVGNLILTFLANNDSIYLIWISISLLGLGYSSTFPCLFSFIEQRITITNNLNSFFVFVTSSVFTINTLVIGNSIDQNPFLFQYLNSTFSILFIILFCILHATDFWKQKFLKM